MKPFDNNLIAIDFLYFCTLANCSTCEAYFNYTSRMKTKKTFFQLEKEEQERERERERLELRT